MLDLILRGGTIIDGSGLPGYRGDVGVAGGRIVSVGRSLSDFDGATAIDAAGKVVAPGVIRTEMGLSRRTPEQYEAYLDLYRTQTALRRAGEPEDIANACFAFVSGLLNKSTGNVLNVDGGVAMAFVR